VTACCDCDPGGNHDNHGGRGNCGDSCDHNNCSNRRSECDVHHGVPACIDDPIDTNHCFYDVQLLQGLLLSVLLELELIEDAACTISILALLEKACKRGMII